MRILKQLPLDDFELQEIKSQAITVAQLEVLRSKTQSYEALLNKRAKKYTAMGLKNQSLSEADYKQLILEEYTFLKRPVIVIDDHIFIGNSKKNIEDLKAFIG